MFNVRILTDYRECWVMGLRHLRTSWRSTSATSNFLRGTLSKPSFTLPTRARRHPHSNRKKIQCKSLLNYSGGLSPFCLHPVLPEPIHESKIII